MKTLALLALAFGGLVPRCADCDPPDGCPHCDDTRATASTCWHPDENGNRVYHADSD